MDTLPTEILVHIFSLGCEETWTHQSRLPVDLGGRPNIQDRSGPFAAPYTPCSRRPKPFAEKLVAVCTRWKEIVEGTSQLNLARLELTARLSYNLVEQDISSELAIFEHSLRTSRGCDLDISLYWASDTSERESRLFLWGMGLVAKHHRQWRCISASFSQMVSPVSALCSFFLSRAEHLIWLGVHLPHPLFPPPSPPHIDLALYGGPLDVDYNPFRGLKSASHLEGNLRRIAQASKLKPDCIQTINVDSSGSTWADFMTVMRLCGRTRFISFSADGLSELPSLGVLPGAILSLPFLTSVDLYLNAEDHAELFFRAVGALPSLESMFLRFFGNVPPSTRIYKPGLCIFPNLKKINIEGVAPQELPLVSLLLGSTRLQEQSFGFFLPTPDDPGVVPPENVMPVLPTGVSTQLLSIPEGMLFSLLGKMEHSIIERLIMSISLTDYYARFYEPPENPLLTMDNLKALQILVPFSMQRVVLDGLEMPLLNELHITGSLYPFDGPWWWEFCSRHHEVLERITKLRLELPALPAFENRDASEAHPLYAFPNVETLIVDHRETASLRWLLFDAAYPSTALPKLTRLFVVGSYLPLSNVSDWFDKMGLRDIMEEVKRTRDEMPDTARLQVVKWCAPSLDECMVVLRDENSGSSS